MRRFVSPRLCSVPVQIKGKPIFASPASRGCSDSGGVHWPGRGTTATSRRSNGKRTGSSGACARARSRLIIDSIEPVGRPSKARPGHVLTVSTNRRQVVGQGARYFGYGLMEAFNRPKKNKQAGQLVRGCILAPHRFNVRLRCRGLDHQAIDSILAASRALGLLGGMGARSRRGYGSLVLESYRIDGRERWSAPTDLAPLKREVANLRPASAPEQLPDYTAMTPSARHVLLTAKTKEPLELLDLVGREMIRYRSWGHNGHILSDVDSEKNFRDDHDLMKSDPKRRQTHPRRIAFGLPHNYGRRKEDQVAPYDPGLDRRASPLFVHIHQHERLVAAVLTFLPARFLRPGRSDISVGGQRVPQQPEQRLYAPIHAFLDRLCNPDLRKEPFDAAIPVP